MAYHEVYMQRCLELAQLGAGNASPNPMVGAVIVYHDKIIGEGWHRKYGGPHAEVHAIADVYESYEDADRLLKDSTMYVSLEPCSHQGKTPPCADLIIDKKIPKVVIAARDPFDRVNGAGIAKLRDANVDVVENVLLKDAMFLNRRFIVRVKQQRPYVILKWAETADGYFAQTDGTQRWISGSIAKTLVHKWRSEEDAVLVGKNTALQDNPHLTVRQFHGRNPKRVVIDKALTLPENLHLFDRRAQTIVFNNSKSDWQPNLSYIALENFDFYLPQNILFQLHLMDVQSVIIEGGAKTLQLFVEAGLWDEARIFVSPTYWLDGIKAPSLSTIPDKRQPIGKDSLLTYFKH